MRKNISISVVMLVVFGFVGIASANKVLFPDFKKKYEISAESKLNSCGTCHINESGGGPRNGFGVAYKNAYVDQDFSVFEKIDSDGDGYTNIEEIKAGKKPGDFNDRPGQAIYQKCVTFFGDADTMSKKPLQVCIVNGVSVDLAPYGGACYIKENKMMVGLRVGIEQLGGNLEYNAEEKRIDITKDGKIVGIMWIGKKMAKIADKDYDLGTAPEIRNGKTFVPVRGVGDSLGAELIYNVKEKIAHFVIIAPKKSCCGG
jgi:hypothetical protein